VGDDRIHSIPEPAFRPQAFDHRPEFQGEQLRVENHAVKVDPRAGRMRTTRPFFGEEGGAPEVKIKVVGPDAMLGDAQLPHAPASLEFEPVIPVLGELDSMLRLKGGVWWVTGGGIQILGDLDSMVRGVGQDGLRLGKATYGLKRRNGRFGWLSLKLRRPSPGRSGDAIESLPETLSCARVCSIGDHARYHAPSNGERRLRPPRNSQPTSVVGCAYDLGIEPKRSLDESNAMYLRPIFVIS
jgi:hypothetical protein